MKVVSFSLKAIMQAYAGAAKLTGQGYLLQQYVPGDWYLVLTPTGKRYRVRPFGSGDKRAACTCPQCEAEGICKHMVWGAELLNTIGEQAYADVEADLRGEDDAQYELGDLHQTSALYE